MALTVGYGNEASSANPNYVAITSATVLTAGSIGARVEAQLQAAFPADPSQSDADRANMKRMAVAIAHAVKWAMRESADIKIGTIANFAGMQRDNTGGNPATLAPTVTKTVSAPVID